MHTARGSNYGERATSQGRMKTRDVKGEMKDYGEEDKLEKNEKTNAGNRES